MRSRRRISFPLAVVVALQGAGAVDAAHLAPLAHWRFDEVSGSTAFDSAGASDGTLLGGAAFAPAEGLGGALLLSAASGSMVDMGDVLGLTDLSGSFSISAWMRSSEIGSTHLVLVGKHQAGYPNGYLFGANDEPGTGGTADHAWLYVTNPAQALPISTTVVNDGEWHHVVGVYAPPPGEALVYVDGGVAEDSVASSTHVDNDASFLVGGFNAPDPVSAFTGHLDELMVFAEALSEAEVELLFRLLFADGFEDETTDSWSDEVGG